MSIATQLIQQATACGVKLFSQDGGLKYEAQSPLPAEFLAQLKAHKVELLAELQQREAANSVTMRPHALLVRVSNLLGCSGDYLLKQGFLEPCDLEEQAATDPFLGYWPRAYAAIRVGVRRPYPNNGQCPTSLTQRDRGNPKHTPPIGQPR
ncbi:hypothetical protein LX59_00946 [Azomonas agilis]|uniref:TubC N-terminal docking domain-containing protein n=1 Tax=Azomonas agilis TaxID=116849 RepID=A0A562J1B4_9GAMM|nr:hypothetical protein [Azomonas agilis]TWH76900.1 hypothetical protein LX59_00946 [Azomonas agilis]